MRCWRRFWWQSRKNLIASDTELASKTCIMGSTLPESWNSFVRVGRKDNTEQKTPLRIYKTLQKGEELNVRKAKKRVPLKRSHLHESKSSGETFMTRSWQTAPDEDTHGVLAVQETQRALELYIENSKNIVQMTTLTLQRAMVVKLTDRWRGDSPLNQSDESHQAPCCSN